MYKYAENLGSSDAENPLLQKLQSLQKKLNINILSMTKKTLERNKRQKGGGYSTMLNPLLTSV